MAGRGKDEETNYKDTEAGAQLCCAWRAVFFFFFFFFLFF